MIAIPFLLSFGILAAGGIQADGTLSGAIIALIALSAMEIVLGIDNLVFLSVLSSKLPKEQQKSARLIGLGLAMGMRIVLLAFIFVILKLKDPFFYLHSLPLGESLQTWFKSREEIDGVSVKDLILIFGGLFLLWKSVKEIHHLVDGHHDEHSVKAVPSYTSVLIQVMILDLVFFARLGHHRCWDGGSIVGHDYGGDFVCHCNDDFLNFRRDVRREEPDCQDARCRLSRHDRRNARCRRLWNARQQRLRLLRDGLLALRGNPQSTRQAKELGFALIQFIRFRLTSIQKRNTLRFLQ